MNASVRYRTFSACFAAALLAAAGSAPAQSCNFRNPLPGGILFSPALDPSSAITRTATTNIRVQCTGNALLAWSFTGANGSSQLQMQHSLLPAVIPYSVEASFRRGPVGNQQWVLTATVLGAAYVNAPAGTYSDQLTATVLP
jgi:spore coat protein U-like protein